MIEIANTYTVCTRRVHDRILTKDAMTEPVHDTARAPTCATFADYVTTLPLHVRDLLAHAKDIHCPDSSLYELLQQKNVNILVASNGGHKGTHGSFGWVIGTSDEVIWGLRRHRARLPHAVLPSQRLRTHVPSPVLDALYSLLRHQNGGRSTCHVLLRQSPRDRGRIPHPGRGLVKLVLATRPRDP
jgi:hypothetical protein